MHLGIFLSTYRKRAPALPQAEIHQHGRDVCSCSPSFLVVALALTLNSLGLLEFLVLVFLVVFLVVIFFVAVIEALNVIVPVHVSSII